jgi:LysM domain
MHQQWRKSITTLAFVLVSAIPAGAMAQAPKTPLSLRPDAPERYIVVPGDTLWSIAQRYTDSPWRWSELWNLNKEEIKNPNRIYPGNVIVLDRASGQLALDSTVKLSPQVRAESIAMTVIPSIPPNVIEPFLSRPLLIEPDGLDNAPTIVATEGSRTVLEPGSRGFVRGMADSKESEWFIYRRGQPLVDPETKTTLGYEALFLGTARVFRAGDPAIVEITSVTREGIFLGDKLVPAGKPQIPVYAPHAPSATIQGQIIALYGNRAQLAEAGPGAIISINRGKSQGVETGDVVALYRLGTTVGAAEGAKYGWTSKEGSDLKIPNERYGLAFVFRVFDRVSYALVMQASRYVSFNDVVQNP